VNPLRRPALPHRLSPFIHYHWSNSHRVLGRRSFFLPMTSDCCAVMSFQRNRDGNSTHHIVEFKVTFRTEQMAVVAIDTGL
jgi:hypothetical protein